jgi:UDP-glucuronate decarboxylase
MSYFHQNAVKIKIARIFNTYGPKMRLNDGRVVSNFIVQALKNEPMTIYGDGKQTRSFQYVDDVIDGLVRLMNSNSDVTGPVNIGNINEYSVEELAGIIRRLTNSKSAIIKKELPEDDPMKRKPDISLAREVLGWEPKVGLEEGLTHTINYYKTKIDHSNYIV